MGITLEVLKEPIFFKKDIENSVLFEKYNLFSIVNTIE